MTLIATTDSLREICARFAAHDFVTVDTEFLRETTFWPQVCVIQIATDDEAVAIDALAEGLDLTPFFDLMANEKVTKVFHAARQDLEIIWHLAKLIPSPLFDTQVAAMVCGFGDQASYGDLVQAICKVVVDKSSRFTDWSRRPLSEAQIAYALADVTHLRQVYRYLVARLETGHDAVQPFIAVHHHRRGVVGVEARDRGVRTVGIEAGEGPATVDEILRQQACHDRLADPAFFAADEIE